MKVHPWLEPKDSVYSKPFNADDYIEYMTASNNNEDVKVLPQDGGRLLEERLSEDSYFRNLRGEAPKEGQKLSKYLQPVATSRQTIGQTAKTRKDVFEDQMVSDQDRTINYVKSVQGGGFGVAPPHPSAPPQVPPNMYHDNPPYAVQYAAPSQMPSPALSDIPADSYVNTPSTHQLQNSGTLTDMNEAESRRDNKPEPMMSSKEKVQAEFAGVFSSDTKPDAATVNQLINEAGAR
jgi:hypothetical protein